MSVAKLIKQFEGKDSLVQPNEVQPTVSSTSGVNRIPSHSASTSSTSLQQRVVSTPSTSLLQEKLEALRVRYPETEITINKFDGDDMIYVCLPSVQHFIDFDFSDLLWKEIGKFGVTLEAKRYRRSCDKYGFPILPRQLETRDVTLYAKQVDAFLKKLEEVKEISMFGLRTIYLGKEEEGACTIEFPESLKVLVLQEVAHNCLKVGSKNKAFTLYVEKLSWFCKLTVEGDMQCIDISGMEIGATLNYTNGNVGILTVHKMEGDKRRPCHVNVQGRAQRIAFYQTNGRIRIGEACKGSSLLIHKDILGVPESSIVDGPAWVANPKCIVVEAALKCIFFESFKDPKKPGFKVICFKQGTEPEVLKFKRGEDLCEYSREELQKRNTQVDMGYAFEFDYNEEAHNRDLDWEIKDEDRKEKESWQANRSYPGVVDWSAW